MLGSTLELPVWLVVVAGCLAVVGLIDRMLMPSFRWMLRRRLDRAIAHLNQKLQLRIQPFKLARRRALIDQLLFDPDVIAAIDEHAVEKGIPRHQAQAKARRYAKEIVPSFSTYTYFKVGTRLARGVSRMLYRVRLGFVDETALASVDRTAAVVFVINHRSNMDYVLVTYMAAATSALSYAVGEWARVWGLQSLIRSMGAYFVRRDSGELLYRRVLSRYVQMSTAAGVTQAMFPEGGLTRDGTLRPPKLGLLSYMVSGFDPHGVRDIVFVPVGLNYDRVLEDRLQTGAIDTPVGDKPRYRFHPGVLAGFLLRQIWLRITGRWHRFGYACVSFGGPLSLRGYLEERGLDLRTLPPAERATEIGKLGQTLMQRIGEVVPVLPVSLAATALLNAPASKQSQGLSAFEIKGRVQALMDELEVRGGHIHIPRRDREYAVEVGLRMLVLRRMVLEADGLYQINPAEVLLLRYYANSIGHLVQPVPQSRGTVELEPLREHAP